MARSAIDDADASRYRLFDCAPVYFNEREIGDAIFDAVVRRKDGEAVAATTTTTAIVAPGGPLDDDAPVVLLSRKDLFVTSSAAAAASSSLSSEHGAVGVLLSDEEMRRIASLDRGYRFFRPEDWWTEMPVPVFH